MNCVNAAPLISSGGVRSIWLRHDLETFGKRLKALSAKIAQDGPILTEDQLRALEKAREEKQTHGEIETEHPGYLGCRDTYVGNIKGVGHIYQQTFIDSYCKTVMVKLYDRKHAITAADMLNDRVLPWYEENGVPLLRILTDRGSEYCGNREHHEFALYLDLEGIDHTRTKTKVHKPMASASGFIRPSRTSSMQVPSGASCTPHWINCKPIDLWVRSYNEERPHSESIACRPLADVFGFKGLALESSWIGQRRQLPSLRKQYSVRSSRKWTLHLRGGCAPFGCATTWRHLASGSRPLSAKIAQDGTHPHGRPACPGKSPRGKASPSENRNRAPIYIYIYIYIYI